MGSVATMGVGAMRLLRSRSPLEAAAFWTVLILVYLALAALAGTRGIGYSERVDTARGSIAFELNPFLWLPRLVPGADPATNPVPFLLWWVLLAALIAEVLMVPVRLRGGIRSRAPRASPTKPSAQVQGSASREGLRKGYSGGGRDDPRWNSPG
jgi:hypothetical protein